MGAGREPYAAVRRALLSVSDPAGLPELARDLSAKGCELVATRGTGSHLDRERIPYRHAEELTGIGDWFQGRIKTLHPGLLGGILAPRDPEGVAELARRHLLPIDLVAVNLYPYERHLAEHPTASDREEFIDIGGVTLLRAAAKNHAFVAVASDPVDYPEIRAELAEHGGLSAALRLELARRAFERTTDYDAAIARTLGAPVSPGFPPRLAFATEPMRLRYGENPHQAASVYAPAGASAASIPRVPLELRKGESLSYTNLVDLDTAWAIVQEFPTPTAVLVKHATPCGVASGPTLAEALARAVATDPVARYGCVVAVNRTLGETDPDALKGVFVDLLAAPSFEGAVLSTLGHRPKLKVVEVGATPPVPNRWEARTALGRLLVQEVDRRELAPTDFRPVTTARATPPEACALDFAWRVVRHARSNAIVLADGSKTVGIGSGQPTRVKAVELAVEVAGDRAKGSVLASDAFFPFPDGIEVAGAAGVKAIIQPGGSLRDPEVIEAAERHGIAMYFTGWRVFRH